MRTRILIGFIALATVTGTLAHGTRESQAAPGPVTIEHFQFSEPSLSVPRGSTVTWINRDEEPHTVTSTAGLFASAGLDTGARFSHRFDAPGTYPYYCALHPHMRGQVVVR